jgi:hypothetical protein
MWIWPDSGFRVSNRKLRISLLRESSRQPLTSELPGLAQYVTMVSMTPRLKPHAFLWLSVLLVSCGLKSPPAVINCVAPDFGSRIHIIPCAPGATSAVKLDKNGNGSSLACPSDDNVEIVVIHNGSTTYILPEKVHIARAGDGIAVSIDADLE